MDENVERVYATHAKEDGTIILLRADGSAIWKGVVGGGANGSGGKTLSVLVRYTYSTVVTPPPNQGQIRTPTDKAIDTTVMWIHRLDYENQDIKFLFVNQIHAGSQLFFQDINDSDSNAVFNVLADPVDEGDYLTVSVECDTTSGVPLAGSGILLGIFV
jgi:hypothetical protein